MFSIGCRLDWGHDGRLAETTTNISRLDEIRKKQYVGRGVTVVFVEFKGAAEDISFRDRREQDGGIK